MNQKPRIYPHRERRSSIHFLIFLLIMFMTFMACSCVTTRKGKDPCPERRGMSGYGYGWIRCHETGRIAHIINS